MRRLLPMIITLVLGVFAFVAYFVPHRQVSGVEQRITQWIPIVASTALILGAVSLFQHHFLRLIKRHPDRLYSVVALGAMLITSVLGLVWGIEEGTPFKDIYDTVYAPLTSAMFSLLAFFLASAAFRSFRIRSVEAAMLLAAALIVMVGRIPVGGAIAEAVPFLDLPVMAEKILEIPTTAAMRAIRIGVGLGMATLSIKIILGLERTYIS